MGLFGNGSLRAHTDDRGSLTLPWGGGGVGVACVVGISAPGAEKLNGAWQDLAPIARTCLESASWSCEVVDFAPRVRDRGEVLAPRAVVRILRPLRGVPRLRVTLPTGGWSPRATGAGCELVAAHGTNVRLRGSLAERALRGEEFALGGPECLIASEDELGGIFAAPVAELAPELLARTRAAWEIWRANLRLPPRAGDEVQRAALRVGIGADPSTMAFEDGADPEAVVTALDLLGCSAELRGYTAANPAAAVHAGRFRAVPDPVPGWLETYLPEPTTWSRASEALAAWSRARAAHGVAVAGADAALEARALRTMRAARTFVEVTCFDERSGLVKAAPDDPLLDPETLRAVTDGFFASHEARARSLTLALAGLLAHDLAAPPHARATLAHALALVGEREAAADQLGVLEREASCHGELRAALALVRAAFALATR